MSGLPTSGYQGSSIFGQPTNVMGQVTNPNAGLGTPQMSSVGGAPAMSTAMAAPRNPFAGSGGLQGFGSGGPPNSTQPQLPGQVPVQNPPMGGVQGNPAYSVGSQPQLNGNYWNQVAQQLAGPQYQIPGLQQPGSGVNSVGGVQTLPGAAQGRYPTAPTVKPGGIITNPYGALTSYNLPGYGLP